jgi:hypothetical protein
VATAAAAAAAVVVVVSINEELLERKVEAPV